MNEHDSERIAGLLASEGMEATDDLESADVVVLNTCCIRENADNKLYGHLGRLKALKQERPDLQIAVGGCLAQKDRELIVERAGHVDVVFGTHNLANAAGAARAGPLRGPGGRDPRGARGLPVGAARRAPTRRPRPPQRVGHHPGGLRQLVHVLHRADRARCRDQPAHGRHRPRGRGARRRRRARDHRARSERQLLRARPRRRAVPPAVRRPAARARRRRRHRPHPLHVTAPEGPASRDHRRDGRVRRGVRAPAPPVAVGERPHAGAHAPRLHRRALPASGSPTPAHAIPDLAVTTDIIVGFPGETDDDFERTLEVVDEAAYDAAYTFVFSPRPGTPAADMVDDFVAPEVAKERMRRLGDVVERHALAKHEARVGRIESLLLEGPSKNDATMWSGRTRQNKLVHFSPGEQAPRRRRHRRRRRHLRRTALAARRSGRRPARPAPGAHPHPRRRCACVTPW